MLLALKSITGDDISWQDLGQISFGFLIIVLILYILLHYIVMPIVNKILDEINKQ